MVWALATGVAEARDPEPLARIPLAPLGFQSLTPESLLDGGSMLTVNFVDHDHLLITFAVHRLMKREPDQRPDDEDRTIAAELVDLPTGRLLAQTDWRLHDHGQYLWPLGNGRFLLRVRDRLSVVAPLASATDAFRQTPLITSSRRIIAVQVSADADLLTVESTRHVGPGVANDVTLVDPTLPDPSQSESAPVQIDFFRLSSTGTAAVALRATPAAVIRARVALSLPMTTVGLLNLNNDGRNHWGFNFNEYTGKVVPLAGFDTTCFPRANFVDHAEFVAFGCRGGTDRQLLAGFNLKGDLMWQQNFSETILAPAFAFAPTAGRFALARVLTTGAVDEDAPLSPIMVSAQEVRVFQSYNGRQLLKVNASPVQRSGGNFALSDDGLQLAVLRQRLLSHPQTKELDAYTERETAVEIYALPALTDRDQAELKAAKQMAPPDTGAPINQALKRILSPNASSEAGATGEANATTAQTPLPLEQISPIPSPTSVEPTSAVLGDPLPDAPRPRPTLYGSDEKATESPATADK